jgi:hypothetical protein
MTSPSDIRYLNLEVVVLVTLDPLLYAGAFSIFCLDDLVDYFREMRVVRLFVEKGCCRTDLVHKGFRK